MASSSLLVERRVNPYDKPLGDEKRTCVKCIQVLQHLQRQPLQQVNSVISVVLCVIFIVDGIDIPSVFVGEVTVHISGIEDILQGELQRIGLHIHPCKM